MERKPDVMPEKVTRVLVVDDHPIVRRGMRDLLQQQGDMVVIAEAENALQAIQAIEKQTPDAAVIDISLKGTDGLELTKAIRARGDRFPILIMSMHDEELYAERVLRAGANGYLMKGVVAEDVVKAVRCILTGDIYVSDRIRQQLLHSLATRTSGEESSPLQRLSDRELEVFRHIGRGFGTRQIAKELHLSVKTIETYRAHIKEKLGLESATELVRYAVRWIEEKKPAAD